MSALLHILEAANGTTPPKTKDGSYCHQRSTNEQRAEFYRSDHFSSLTVCIPTDKTRKAFCDYLGYEVFREERNV